MGTQRIISQLPLCLKIFVKYWPHEMVLIACDGRPTTLQKSCGGKVKICSPSRSSETLKQSVLLHAFVWFSRARRAHTLTGRGKSPFHPLRTRCFVSSWVLYLLKNTGWFTVEKVSFLWSTIYPANFGKKKKKKKIGHLELVPSSISPSLVFFFLTFDKTISYWILGPLRSTR